MASSNKLIVICAVISVVWCGMVNTYQTNDAGQLIEKPDWLRTCPKDNPTKDNCYRTLFQSMFPALARGVPEAGIEPFEPLRITSVAVARGSGSLTLAGGFKNLNVRGPSNATVRRAVLDLQKKILEFDLEIPVLNIEANYNLKGNILLLPLVGSGDVTMTLRDVKSNVATKISLQQLPEEVIQIEEMKVTFLIGGMRIHLDNLFNGNKVLGASLNLFLNQNSHEVISELQPELEKGLGSIFQKLWNNVYSKIPLNLWLH